MAFEVLMPKLGMTMTEGTVAEWLVPDGQGVESGGPVFRLETEKIEFQVEAEVGGTVRHLVPAGTVVAPGAVVGFILAQGESLPDGVVPATSAAAGSETGGARSVGPAAQRRGAAEAQTSPGERKASPAASNVGGEPPPASPIARRLAAEFKIDLRSVAGTGPGGRITKEDVEAAAGSRPPSGSSPASVEPTRERRVIPLRGMRGVIAERMHTSLQEMAQLTMSMEADMNEAEKLRAQLIREWEEDGIRPSFTDLVVRAVAKALPLHPGLNAEVTAAGLELLTQVHIGMAVALDNGLVVPVIRNAPGLSLQELAVESTRLAAAARAGTLGPDDYAGGTFSVTSLGMDDVDFFTPIINPPNVAILGIGRIRDAVRWEGQAPVRTRRLTLSLTIDHRAVDGVPGAAFLRRVRDLLAAPYRLLV